MMLVDHLPNPLGFAGINHCLSFATGGAVEVSSHRAALDYLLTHGQRIWHEGDMHIFTLGDFGFVWDAPTSGIESFLIIHARMLALVRDEPQVLQPLRGRRVMLLCAMTDVEGTGETSRCWHGVMSQAGEWLHLNRFFGFHGLIS